uniref:GMIP/FCHO2-like FCH domain-containing protein n=1 Tax=Branchiostoma floridae TaxID=7739 RepID=C3YIJ6_BRAFL|eukprot:XP_002603918.1 hypothetical protein BRAFLDRAFT_105959 [Branchiostoma floridae]
MPPRKKKGRLRHAGQFRAGNKPWNRGLTLQQVKAISSYRRPTEDEEGLYINRDRAGNILQNDTETLNEVGRTMVLRPTKLEGSSRISRFVGEKEDSDEVDGYRIWHAKTAVRACVSAQREHDKRLPNCEGLVRLSYKGEKKKGLASAQTLGEKNNGFDVVYHNMKHGQISVKEMVEYLRESASVQELNSKSWNKLAKQAANSSQQGTFSPVWQIVRLMNEKMATVYTELVHRLQEVAKELQKYGEEQRNKHKSVKEEVQPTADVVTSFQSTTAAVLKAKENYNTKCLDYERLKREGASPKEVEKAEAKFTKAKEDYTQLVEKYENTRVDFTKKMTDSSNQFQEIEEIHLSYMFDIIAKYAQCFHHAHFTIMQIEEDFKRQSEDLGIQKLIQNFAESKGTGTEKPAAIEFEECDLSSLPPAISMESVENNGKETPVVEKAVDKLTKKKEIFTESVTSQ